MEKQNTLSPIKEGALNSKPRFENSTFVKTLLIYASA